MKGPLLRHEDLFHTGIIVDDLASAKDEYGSLLGLTWRGGGADIALITDEGVRTVPTAYALSREGPHRLELVQSLEGTLWTVTEPGRQHHLGWFVDDLGSTSAELASQGATWLATIALDETAPPMCSYHQLPNGLCVEIVDRSFRRMLLGREGSTE
jgi:hypothetical protein